MEGGSAGRKVSISPDAFDKQSSSKFPSSLIRVLREILRICLQIPVNLWRTAKTALLDWRLCVIFCIILRIPIGGSICYGFLDDWRSSQLRVLWNTSCCWQKLPTFTPQMGSKLASGRALCAVYASSHPKKGALPRIFGFLDGTARPICRPTKHREILYSGRKRFRCGKW